MAEKDRAPRERLRRSRYSFARLVGEEAARQYMREKAEQDSRVQNTSRKVDHSKSIFNDFLKNYNRRAS